MITVELPREADDQHPSRRWNLYGDMLLAAPSRPEPLRGVPVEASIP